MAQTDENQRRVFQFLNQRCITQELFTLGEFQTATGFSNSSFKTYFSKQFKDLLEPCAGNSYRVALAFRQFTWPKFRDEIVSQKRKLRRKYHAICHKHVLLFEFFMPLRNEEWLKSALDSLFYKDAVISRLKVITGTELNARFPRKGDADDHYFQRLCGWVSETFGGYSISHVSGRFKVGCLKSRREIAEAEASGASRYLVDETTAVVRFIFPCGSGSNDEAEKQAEQIRWVFEKVFVQTILEVVNGEDEIWLLESGMRHQLHIFKAED